MNPAAAAVATKVVENKSTPYIILGMVVIGGVASILVTMKILEALQIKDTREDKRAKKRASKLYAEEAFDPAHAYNHPSKVTISTQDAEILARTIYNANGWTKSEKDWGGNWLGFMYDDDEDAARGAVRQARTSYNLSKVAEVFFKKYKVGLLDYLEDFNGELEMEKYYKIVENYKS